MSLPRRLVVVHRRSELDELLARHATRGQVEFFLRTRGRTVAEVQDRHDEVVRARRAVDAAAPDAWRRASVERADLDRFAFAPEDVVVTVGQDGLVANVAKYLDGQPVVGVTAGASTGVLATRRPHELPALLAGVDDAPMTDRTMVEASVDDGQRLVALNDVYVGDPGHQSARWEIVTGDGRHERQSCSGLVVGTGTGASGWCASLATTGGPPPPRPDEAALQWYVREAWPSPATGTDVVHGRLGPEDRVAVDVAGPVVVFGDGMEADRLHADWGQRVEVRVAARVLRHLV